MPQRDLRQLGVIEILGVVDLPGVNVKRSPTDTAGSDCPAVLVCFQDRVDEGDFILPRGPDVVILLSIVTGESRDLQNCVVAHKNPLWLWIWLLKRPAVTGGRIGAR